VDAPWYIRNDNLHNDLDVATVYNVIKHYAQRHEQRLRRHINVEALQLLMAWSEDYNEQNHLS
jgi:hypothetical protein